MRTRSAVLVSLLLTTLHCRPPLDEGDADAGPCSAFDTESIGTPSLAPGNMGAAIDVVLRPPSTVGADSATVTMTKGATTFSATLTGEENRATFETTDPGPWSLTVVYARAGCADRTAGPSMLTADLTPPGPVTNVELEPDRYSAVMRWTDPSDDFDHTTILMKLSDDFAGPRDPEAHVVCSRPDCESPYTAVAVPAGRPVYFAFYTLDRAGNYGVPVVASTTVQSIDSWLTVAGSGIQSFGVAPDGSLWACGRLQPAPDEAGTVARPWPTRVGSGTGYTHVTAAHSVAGARMLALRADGTMWQWQTIREPSQVGTDSDWVDADVGEYVSVAVRADGTIWTWLTGEMPAQVGTDSDWASAVASGLQVYAIKSDRTLWTWGMDGAVARVGTAADWLSISVSGGGGVGIRAPGTLWAWGSAFPILSMSPSEPTQVGTDTDWIAASAAYFSGAGIRAGGALYTWGENRWGQIGDGTTETRMEPVRIDDSGWVAVEAAGAYMVGLQTDGIRYAWGANVDGFLCAGDLEERHVPTQLPEIPSF